MATLAGAPPTMGAPTMAERRDTALEAVFHTHLRSLTRTAVLLVDDPAQAEDIVQEAFVKAFATWHRLEDETKAAAYLHRIVVNTSRSALRRRAVARRHPSKAAAPRASAEEDALAALERAVVVRELRSLPRRQREALVLRHYLGLSEAEAASAMGVSTGSVKAYASRGLVELSRRMEVER